MQQYSIARTKWTESIQQAIHESTVHVDSLLGDTPPECHRFQWIKAKILVKVKKECAVWKSNKKNPVKLAQAVNKWEEPYGKAAKTWNMGQHKYQPQHELGEQQQQQSQWKPPSNKDNNSG